MERLTSNSIPGIISSRVAGIAVAVCSILLLAYTTWRAWALSFTIDEGFSFIFYTLDSYTNIISFKRIDPNNHVLNTLCMKFFSKEFGLSEFSLRLASVIAHALFLFFTWQMLKKLPDKRVAVTGWLLLNLNPFMVDFFSLARGYAMSWAFMAGSLYFLKSFLEQRRYLFFNIVFCFAFAALASLASFTLLNYYLALIGFCILTMGYLIIYQWKNIKGNISLWISIPVAGYISYAGLKYALNASVKLKEAKVLYFGGIDGFWHDTVGSIAEKAMYGAAYTDAGIIMFKIIVALAFAGICVFMIRHLFGRKDLLRQYAFPAALFFLVCAITAGIIIQFKFLDTRYVLERAAIFLLLIFVLLCTYVVQYGLKGSMRMILCLVAGSVAIIHFGRCVNFTYFYEWQADAQTKEMMQDMRKIRQKKILEKGHKIVFQPDWLFATSTMFYQYLYHYDWMEPIESKKTFNMGEDYYFMNEGQYATLKDQPVKIIKAYTIAHTVLMQNEAPKPKKTYFKETEMLYDSIKKDTALQKYFTLQAIEGQTCVTLDKDVFTPEIKCGAALLKDKKDLIIRARATVYFPGKKDGQLIINMVDKNNKTLRWDCMKLEDYILQDSGWMTIPFVKYLDKIPDDVTTVKFGVWNPDGHRFYVSKVEGEIFSY